MKTVHLEVGMPLIQQALSKFGIELAAAKQQGFSLVKLIHGYGSSGVGGEIRIAVQKRLREMRDKSELRGYIFGEDWAVSDEQTWKVIRTHPELKQDRDLGRRNLGITIVLL